MWVKYGHEYGHDSQKNALSSILLVLDFETLFNCLHIHMHVPIGLFCLVGSVVALQQKLATTGWGINFECTVVADRRSEEEPKNARVGS